jgi:hypothetical protein
MTIGHESDKIMTPTELRKQILITQGAMYRSGIVSSKAKVISGMRAESLARSAIKQLGLAAFAAWRGRSGLAASSLSTVLPLVVGGISSLWRQPKLKPIVRGTLIAGAAAAAYVFISKWKNRP